jgi:SIR2-like domain
MNESKPKVTFLVGAGLVRDAELPLSIELTRMFRNFLTEAAESKPDGGSATHLRLYRFLVGCLRCQMGLNNRDPDRPINIEQLATAALRLKSRLDNPLAPYVSGWNQTLIDLESEHDNLLAGFLDAIYSKLNTWLTQTDSSKIAYLTRFEDFKRYSESVDVFSLNYDLCIEKAFAEARLAFVNGFDETGWNPSLFFSTRSIRLFKLHGSLDWVEDEVHGICAFTSPRHPHAEDFEGQQPPLLIFGTDAKLTGKQPFLTLLHSFSSRLNESDVLIIIGYSFSDEYLNEMIEQRMSRNTRIKVIVVSPGAEEAIRRVKFLHGSPRVIPINKGAKAALDEAVVLKVFLEIAAGNKDESPFQ